MSWDATLRCDSCGHTIIERNYTSNTDQVIRAAGGERWPGDFHGLTGAEGAAYLDRVIHCILRDLPHLEKLNPSNGWGNAWDLAGVLRELRDAVPEAPCRWEVSW